jgi:hypothetical protein
MIGRGARVRETLDVVAAEMHVVGWRSGTQVFQASPAEDLGDDLAVAQRVHGIGQLVSTKDGLRVVDELHVDRGTIVQRPERDARKAIGGVPQRLSWRLAVLQML